MLQPIAVTFGLDGRFGQSRVRLLPDRRGGNGGFGCEHAFVFTPDPQMHGSLRARAVGMPHRTTCAERSRLHSAETMVAIHHIVRVNGMTTEHPSQGPLRMLIFAGELPPPVGVNGTKKVLSGRRDPTLQYCAIDSEFG